MFVFIFLKSVCKKIKLLTNFFSKNIFHTKKLFFQKIFLKNKKVFHSFLKKILRVFFLCKIIRKAVSDLAKLFFQKIFLKKYRGRIICRLTKIIFENFMAAKKKATKKKATKKKAVKKTVKKVAKKKKATKKKRA